MLSFFRSQRSRVSAASTPPQTRLYVVGDIHGRADLLDRLARKIEADSRSGPQTMLTVFLGDYVDRGSDGAGVVRRLAARDFPTPFEALKGNHEQAMLDALANARAFDFWRRIGGVETLASYGVAIEGVRRGQGFEQARDDLRRRVAPAQVEFLRALPIRRQIGDYFFCHAGVRPGVPLDQQREEDLLSIRDAFLTSSRNHGKMIVHGHTPVEAVDFRANRINIDTGAYLTGRLTCLVLEAGAARTIEA